MLVPTSRRLAAVLTAALVATVLAVTAGAVRTPGAASAQAGPAQVEGFQHAAHPRLADGPDGADHVVHPAVLGPGPDQHLLAAVVDDRAHATDRPLVVAVVPSIPRGPPGR